MRTSLMHPPLAFLVRMHTTAVALPMVALGTPSMSNSLPPHLLTEVHCLHLYLATFQTRNRPSRESIPLSRQSRPHPHSSARETHAFTLHVPIHVYYYYYYTTTTELGHMYG